MVVRRAPAPGTGTAVKLQPAAEDYRPRDTSKLIKV